MLSEDMLDHLTALRRTLHQYPEISREEKQTAQRMIIELKPLEPTEIITNLGGHGVAAVFDSGEEGPTVLFRAELDALPIQEKSDKPWASKIAGKGHLCGHDGHMAMLIALGHCIKAQPHQKGRIILMFQPAEEDGSGARAVVNDPKFRAIQPDWAFAIHNEPGRPFGFVATRAGLINCASQGLEISLMGKTAHAATPEDGTAPTNAIAELIPALQALNKNGPIDENFARLTITHIHMGEATFGIAPAEAKILLTLRTAYDDSMAALHKAAIDQASNIAKIHGLEVAFAAHDIFAASLNDGEATQIAQKAMDHLGIKHGTIGLPMLASEDFGVFGHNARSAMLCLGPGEDHPALHNPDYDFPDALIPIGCAIYQRIAHDILGTL